MNNNSPVISEIVQRTRKLFRTVRENASQDPSLDIVKAWESNYAPSESEVAELVSSIAVEIIRRPPVDSERGKSLSIKLVYLYNYINRYSQGLGLMKWLGGVAIFLTPWKVGRYINDLPIVNDGGREKIVTLQSYDDVGKFVKENVQLIESCRNDEAKVSKLEYEKLCIDTCADYPDDWREVTSRFLQAVDERIIKPKRDWDRAMYGVVSIFTLILGVALVFSNWGSAVRVGILSSSCALLLSVFACLQEKYELEFGVCVDTVASSSIYQKIGSMTLTGVPMTTILSGEKLLSAQRWAVAVVFVIWLLNVLVSLVIESIKVYSNIKVNNQ